MGNVRKDCRSYLGPAVVRKSCNCKGHGEEIEGLGCLLFNIIPVTVCEQCQRFEPKPDKPQ